MLRSSKAQSAAAAMQRTAPELPAAQPLPLSQPGNEAAQQGPAVEAAGERDQATQGVLSGARGPPAGSPLPQLRPEGVFAAGAAPAGALEEPQQRCLLSCQGLEGAKTASEHPELAPDGAAGVRPSRASVTAPRSLGCAPEADNAGACRHLAAILHAALRAACLSLPIRGCMRPENA